MIKKNPQMAERLYETAVAVTFLGHVMKITDFFSPVLPKSKTKREKNYSFQYVQET